MRRWPTKFKETINKTVMRIFQNPEFYRWLKIIAKILVYAIGVIAAAYGVDAAAAALW